MQRERRGWRGGGRGGGGGGANRQRHKDIDNCEDYKIANKEHILLRCKQPSLPSSLPLDSWIHGPLDLSTLRSIDPWVHRTLDLSTLGSIDPWIHRPLDLSTLGSADLWICGPLDPSTVGPMDPWICRPLDLLTLGSVDPWICQSLHPLILGSIGPWICRAVHEKCYPHHDINVLTLTFVTLCRSWSQMGAQRKYLCDDQLGLSTYAVEDFNI